MTGSKVNIDRRLRGIYKDFCVRLGITLRYWLASESGKLISLAEEKTSLPFVDFACGMNPSQS
jgi:hypothetical protein